QAAPSRRRLQASLLVEPRPQRHLERAAVEETDDARRRLEEVEGLTGRRRVERDLAVAAAVRHLEQTLDRHVFEDAAEAAREVLIEAVVEHPRARLGVRALALH